MGAVSLPAAPPPLYEQPELKILTGGALRPGGVTLTRELLTCCRPAPGARVLDVGCGSGHSLAVLADEFGLEVSGVDPSAAMLARAARRVPQATLARGRVEGLPYADGSFDILLCECVLSLGEDEQRSLAEMDRVLRPGGLLILTDIYSRDGGRAPQLAVTTCLSRALPLTAITDTLTRTGYSLLLVRDRSDLLKQLAGQIIFSCGSLEQFWALFMDPDNARRTACTLAGVRLGYYALVAVKGEHHG